MTYFSAKSNLWSRIACPFIALFMVVTLLCGGLLNVVDAQRATAARLRDDQRILHVLNRLGYGARPGDVERVKAIGVDKYIELQLNPEKISDAASEAKLQNL